MRGEKVFPAFVDPENPELLSMASGLIELFRAADNRTITALEAELENCEWNNHPLRAALSKLLFDRCEQDDDDRQVDEQRWEILQLAESLRATSDYPNFLAFQYDLAKRLGSDVAQLRELLYSDLPEFRRVKQFQALTPSALLHRLNSAQIQGLLINALSVVVTLNATLAEKRCFFRCLKFQRLLSEFFESDAGLTVSLSGPMQLFQSNQSYGLRLANFFPYILHLPQWQLEAEIKLNGKRFKLSVSDKLKIKSHYREMSPFIPTELTAFLQVFNTRNNGWLAELSDKHIQIGKQSYCFPDFMLRNASGEIVHVELFHKWHSGQLISRLDALKSSPNVRLMLGVAEELRSNQKIHSALENSQWFNQNGFTFKIFPTPKAVVSAVTRYGELQAGKSTESTSYNNA